MTVEQAFELCNLAALISWLALIFAPIRVQGGGFASLSAFQTLFSDRHVALAGFVHYLAFDLFVGLWIAERADAMGISRFVQAPILVVTFLLGPLGFFLFQVVRGLSSVVRTTGPQSSETAR